MIKNSSVDDIFFSADIRLSQAGTFFVVEVLRRTF